MKLKELKKKILAEMDGMEAEAEKKGGEYLSDFNAIYLRVLHATRIKRIIREYESLRQEAKEENRIFPQVESIVELYEN